MRALLFLLAALASLGVPASAHTGPLIIVLLPGTSLRDWRGADAPCLHRLLATGALAVMNTRTARLPNDHTRETEESAALTLGAGSRAASVAEAGRFMASAAPLMGVTAGEVYTRRTGLTPPPGADVNVGWPALLQANRGRGYDVRVGNLADALAAAAVPIRAGGGPLAFLVAASGGGTVLPARSLRTAPNTCLVWDAGGDLHTADGVLTKAVALTVARDGRLLVVSPCAGDDDYAHGRRLTPIVEWGAGIPAGLLNSPSTRRPGLVSDTDFAPTVAAYFGVSKFPTLPFGRPWAAVVAPQAVPQVSDLETQAYRQAQGMRLLPYLAVLLALWMGAGAALAASGRMPPLWPLAPPALLLAALGSTGVATAAVLAPLCLLTAAAAFRLVGAPRTLLAILAVLAAVLTLDMVTGGRLMRQSLLGYSAVEGARYYGIGNEAMGVLVPSLLVLTARLWRPVRLARAALALLLFLVAALLGSPQAGAKAGGLLVSLAAFGSLLFSLSGRRWSPRVILLMASAVVLTMAGAAAVDAFWPGHVPSHFGEAIRRALSGGIGELGDVAARKLAVEGRLAYRSAWGLTLWVGLACLRVTWHLGGAVAGQERALRVAGLVTLAACLLLNDAGVVAAALCVVLLWSDEACRAAKKKPPEALPLPGAVG